MTKADLIKKLEDIYNEIDADLTDFAQEIQDKSIELISIKKSLLRKLEDIPDDPSDIENE